MKRGYVSEVKRKRMLESDGWLVFRVSGSIGYLDLLAIKKHSINFIVRFEQVKSTKKKAFYFDEKSKSEWNRLRDVSKAYGIPAFFEIEFKTGKGLANLWAELRVNGKCPKKVELEETDFGVRPVCYK